MVDIYQAASPLCKYAPLSPTFVVYANKKFFCNSCSSVKKYKDQLEYDTRLVQYFFCGNAANKKETSHVVVIQENTNNSLINSLYFLTNLK